VQIRRFTTEEALQPWIESWHHLAAKHPFRQPEWLLTWARHYLSETANLCVIAAIEDGRLRGLLPFYVDDRNQTLRFLGDGRVCTDYASVLLDEQFYESISIEAMVDHLLSDPQTSALWNKIHLEAVDPSNRLIQRFRSTLLQKGAHVVDANPANTWVVDISGGWNELLKSVSKNSRKAFRNRAEELQKTRVRWVQDGNDLNEFFPILIDLHQRRRAALGDEGCFADPRFEKFLKEVATNLLAHNQLQAFSIWLDDQPIAAEIGFRSATHWYCYQAGIEPNAMDHQPGKLANILILRDAEKFGIQYVDFLRGDEPYKQQLKANPTPLQDWTFTRPGALGTTSYYWMLNKNRIKNTVKRLATRK
jgi:CelD/BcsL family acetyltransferase involved in cellulose biosynthesis